MTQDLLEAPEDDDPMPLTEHLGELRKRVIIAVIFIGLAFMAALMVELQLGNPILSLFRGPLDARNVPLVFDELTEPFFTTIRVAFYTSLFLTFPITLSQIWLFVRPALYPKEQRMFWPFFLSSCLLFLGGGLFGYFVVIPYGYDFFLDFQTDVTLPSLRMSDYLSLTIHLLFAFGLVFELPIVSFFLTKMDVIDSEWLSTNRKYAFVGMFVVGALLTPPDVFTQTLMAGPLIILYEASIWVSKFAELGHHSSTEADG